MKPEQRQFAQILLDLGLVKIALDKDQYFTYASGQKGPVYCDNRPLISHVAHREWVMSYWWEILRDRWPNVQALVGLATAGIPHGAWLAQEGRLPFAYIRSKPKDHGQGKLLEGDLKKGSKVVLIEDLVNQGSSSLPAVTALKGLGLEVLGVSALVSYGFKQVKAQFDALGSPLSAMIELEEILEHAQSEGVIDQRAVADVRNWLNSR